MNEDADENPDLFRKEMDQVRPLRADKVEPFHRRPPPRPLPQPRFDDERESTDLSEQEVETGDYLEFSRPGIQQRLFQDLRRGRLEPALELDLHGLSVAYAGELLDEFLRECRRRRIRCARIIHGKGLRSAGGQPVLKQKVNYWLRLRDEVLAFCSAPPWAGGAGAVHLLLRNPGKGRRRQHERR